MKKRVRFFFDYLAWVAFIILLIYFLLKVFGILKSPPLADIIAILSGGYFIGRYAMKIDAMSNDIENVKEDVKEINDKCPIFKDKKHN